ncbi:MAG: hypothetical protein AABY49_10780 [Planctomycetota bacterium]
MNQIVGADGFSIMNNLRLVIIAAIFIAIIVAFFLSRIVRNRGTIKRKYMQTTNPYDASSSEKRHDSSVVDDFYSMEDAIKEEKAGKGTAETGVEIGQESVDDLEKIETDMKDTAEDVTTKLEADIQDVRNEITTRIEGLISKIEEGEKDVVNKVKNVIDAKVQEALIKGNDRVSEALQTQRNSTALVLEKIVDSLRMEEAQAGILPSDESEKLVERKVGFEEAEENKGTLVTLAGSLVQEALNKINGSIGEALRAQRNSTASVLEGLINSLRTEEVPAVIAPSEETERIVEEKVKFEETEERDLEPPDGDKDILEKLARSLQMRERSVGISSSGESKVVDEENVPPEERKEKELELPPEAKEEIKAEGKEPIEAIASSGEVEENIQDKAVGESADFDIQEFLKEVSVGISPFDEPKEVVEKRKRTEAVTSSEEIEEKELYTAKGEETKEKEQEKVTGKSVDFDIQEFLEELGTPPSEKDVKSERG